MKGHEIKKDLKKIKDKARTRTETNEVMLITNKNGQP